MHLIHYILFIYDFQIHIWLHLTLIYSCVYCLVLLSFFLLDYVLSVLLRCTASDYLLSVLKHELNVHFIFIHVLFADKLIWEILVMPRYP